MWKYFLSILALAFVISCNKDNNNTVKFGTGQIWLSGGLVYCTEQIHMDNGTKLTVQHENIKSLTAGDKVNVRYKEIGVNKNCLPLIDCEIISIEKVR